MDENKLIEFLEGLTPEDFDRILTRFPGVVNYVPSNGAQIARATALIHYFRSTAGLGMARLAEVVNLVFFGEPKEEFDAKPAATSNSVIGITSLRAPGGAIGLTSHFYVPRVREENELLGAANQERGIAVINSARQTGKTTLLSTLYARVLEKGEMRPVMIDFQTLDPEDFQSAATLWKAIISEIARTLEIENWETRWNETAPARSNLLEFHKSHLFARKKAPVVLLFDEVDTIFKYPEAEFFFSQLRGFYNAGATNPYWQQIRWVLSTSSDPAFFITNVHESPFNIGNKITLNSFTASEIAGFAERHGLRDTTLPKQIVEYVAGRPYLTHLILYHLAKGDTPTEQIWEAHTVGGGIFEEHLERYQKRFAKDASLREAMRDIVQDRGCKELALCHRLEGAGLAHKDKAGKFVPTCRLYQEYFQAVL